LRGEAVGGLRARRHFLSGLSEFDPR
jgi:hypothetical protein